MVELNRADVVEVPEQREQTPLLLVVPDLDLVVVATRNKQGLCRVEVDAAHRTCSSALGH